MRRRGIEGNARPHVTHLGTSSARSRRRRSVADRRARGGPGVAPARRPGPGTAAPSLPTFAIGAELAGRAFGRLPRHGEQAVVDDVHWADVASTGGPSFRRAAAGARAGRPARRRTRRRGQSARRRAILHPDRARPPRALGRPRLARALLGYGARTGGNGPADRDLRRKSARPGRAPQLLTEPQRLGREPLPEALAAGPLVQRAFADRVRELGDPGREALLLLAAAGEPDSALGAMLELPAAPPSRRGKLPALSCAEGGSGSGIR